MELTYFITLAISILSLVQATCNGGNKNICKTKCYGKWLICIQLDISSAVCNADKATCDQSCDRNCRTRRSATISGNNIFESNTKSSNTIVSSSTSVNEKFNHQELNLKSCISQCNASASSCNSTNIFTVQKERCRRAVESQCATKCVKKTLLKSLLKKGAKRNL